MSPLLYCVLNVVLVATVGGHLQLDPPRHNNAFDLDLYEDVLNPEECARQLDYIFGNDTMLMMQFLDAGARTPRGVLTGNFRDMGNYFQCLGIQKQVEDTSIEGKYCVMQLPLLQDEFELPILPEIPQIPWPNITWPPNNNTSETMNEKIITDLGLFNSFRRNIRIFLGEDYKQPTSRVADDSPFAGMQFELAICLPKVCSVKNVVQKLTPNSTGTLKVEESFCRLPNDKTWVAADTVAIAIFSFIGLLVIFCTSYDVYLNVILEKDPYKTDTLNTTFSVFTNSRKFFTFRSSPNAITCLDGIRSLAIMWVIVGHTFVVQLNYVPANPLDMLNFMTAFTSLWITSATITVDTFFMISGLLLVYTTASKLSRMSLLKNLHLFYLNRLFRMFPVLATGVLLQASLQNRVTDGPYWRLNAANTHYCRQYWWTTLLYVQNLVNPHTICLVHTWYLAIDMQMYIISPIILFWVLGGNKRSAWTALIGAFICVMTASTVYNFIMEFQSVLSPLSRTPEEFLRYMKYYYLHPLPRAAPFFVGMIFGYALHLVKGRSIRIPKPVVAILWIIAGATSTTIFIAPYYTIQPDWDNQTVDNILNSFMRPAWAASIAWLVFACTKGYGGPINWFLSLHVFKIIGRLSYAMYILHLPLIYVINGTALAPIFFSVERSMHRFLVDLTTTVITSYLVTIVIDLPFSRLIGMLLGGGKGKKPLDAKKDDEIKVLDDEAPDFADLIKSQTNNTQMLKETIQTT